MQTQFQSSSHSTVGTDTPTSPAAASLPNAAPRPGSASEALSGIAISHGFGTDAVRAMWAAILIGHGAMAQFSHPEFGGSGQWMRGGMLMVGDMFDDRLRARVHALCEALAAHYDAHADGALARSDEGRAVRNASTWWPAGLGEPSASGTQADVRYAYFPGTSRLAVERGAGVELYDTQDHQITGISQQQSATADLRFSSQSGDVDLRTLPRLGDPIADTAVVAEAGFVTAQPAPVRHAPIAATRSPQPGFALTNPLDVLPRLAELHKQGVLTQEEFVAKKKELLARL